MSYLIFTIGPCKARITDTILVSLNASIPHIQHGICAIIDRMRIVTMFTAAVSITGQVAGFDFRSQVFTVSTSVVFVASTGIAFIIVRLCTTFPTIDTEKIRVSTTVMMMIHFDVASDAHVLDSLEISWIIGIVFHYDGALTIAQRF